MPSDARAELLAAIGKRIEACRQEWTWNLEQWDSVLQCHVPARHDHACEKCRDLRDFPALLEAALSEARAPLEEQIQVLGLMLEQARAEQRREDLHAIRMERLWPEGPQTEEDRAYQQAVSDCEAAVLRAFPDPDAATGTADDQTYSRECVDAARRMLRNGLPRSRSYREDLFRRLLADPEFVKEYLRAAEADGDPAVLQLAKSDIAAAEILRGGEGR